MSKIPLGNSMINENQVNKKSVGLLLKKDMHLSELQIANRQLRQELDREMNRFQFLSKQQNIASTREKQLQTLINLASIQVLFSSKEIQKTKKQEQSNYISLSELKEKTLKANAQVQLLSQQIQRLIEELNESEPLIKRYREELRHDQILLKSEKNMANIRNSLKNSIHNYQKHMEILQKKLESKKKYLNILQKKINSQQELIKQSSKKVGKKESFGNKPLKSDSFGTILSKKQQVSDKIDKADRDEMKKMNELIRKKNSLLLKKR